jgi:hypothetical protein
MKSWSDIRKTPEQDTVVPVREFGKLKREKTERIR